MRMKTFWTPNIDGRGRLLRGAMGLALLAAGAFAWDHSRLLTALLAASGIFAIIEATRGWCLLRACGIRTRL